MKAWQVCASGEPEEMKLAQTEIPAAGPGQVRIQNRAAGLNFFDILQIQGRYQVKPPFPFTPGAEVSGIVDSVGAGVSRFSTGDAVLAFTRNGGYAEYAIAEADRTFPVCPGMDFPQAAALPVVYHTSYFGLQRRAGLAAGEWLLVHAGASGVGFSAIQIGKALGARIIATAGSAAKLEFCTAQGADHVLNYRDPGWVERVKEITRGRGADVIYDPVGGDVFDQSTRCIAPEGRLLVIGFASGRIPAVQANRILLKNISVVGVHWGQYVHDHPDFLSETQRVLAAMYTGRQVRPVVSVTYPLEQAPIALRDMAERKLIGKAVLVME